MTHVCTFYLCDAANIVDIHFCILWLVLYHFVFIGLVGIILECVIIASLLLVGWYHIILYLQGWLVLYWIVLLLHHYCWLVGIILFCIYRVGWYYIRRKSGPA